MNDSERIGTIQKAVNNEQLDNAMQGYKSSAIAAHPKLANNKDFDSSMESGQFNRALQAVRSVRRQDEEEYFDVIRVLEFAATRQLAIKMF
jgi:hypothetical protein